MCIQLNDIPFAADPHFLQLSRYPLSSFPLKWANHRIELKVSFLSDFRGRVVF